MQSLLAQVTPAIYTAEHRSACNPRHTDPVTVGLHRTELPQRRCLVGLPLTLSIPLAPGQKQLHALPGAYLNVLDLQATQLVAAKGTPEADQQQCAVTPATQQPWQITVEPRLLAGTLQPHHTLFQFAQLQRLGLFLRLRVQGADALQHLPYQRRLCWVGKALADVPLRQSSQAQLQRAARQGASVIH
ncbi:hypothetical protein D9M68_707900 [compost metagenome]